MILNMITTTMIKLGRVKGQPHGEHAAEQSEVGEIFMVMEELNHF